MSLDITDWHEEAAGRGSVCNWMMKGTRYFREFGYLVTATVLEPTTT